MSHNMKALKWQLMQSKLSENFGKWRPYLELFLAVGGAQGAEISLGAAFLAPPHGTVPVCMYTSASTELRHKPRCRCIRDRQTDRQTDRENHSVTRGRTRPLRRYSNTTIIIITSAKTEIMRPGRSVCHSVCVQPHANSYASLYIKFFTKRRSWPSMKVISFWSWSRLTFTVI